MNKAITDSESSETGEPGREDESWMGVGVTKNVEDTTQAKELETLISCNSQLIVIDMDVNSSKAR